MKIKRFEFNMFPVNCYVLWDETNEAVVIDPGCFYDEEKQALKNFIVTKADIDALVPKIELLRDIVEKVCKERIAEYCSYAGSSHR